VTPRLYLCPAEQEVTMVGRDSTADLATAPKQQPMTASDPRFSLGAALLKGLSGQRLYRMTG
jgi:hypothetical protein